MATTPEAERVPPAAYTEEYFRSGVEGHAEFAASGGERLSPRLARALEVARPQPGERLLDIACGRGEVVRHGALRGAAALGIDYAAASMAIARDAIADAGKAAVARMDAGRLALRPASFDVALMLDFVEHVHQPELERAFAEVARALRPGGRLVIHTSPNRVFENIVYRYYVRNVHRVVLGIAGVLRVKGRFVNEIVMPTAAQPPHDEYERELHVNPQSAGSLRAALERNGLRVRSVGHWEPPADRFFPAEERWYNFWLGTLDVVRFLRPFSRWRPLNRLFSNHIWIVAERS